MKTFLRENKGKSIFLIILILGMISLWRINIYQVWYFFTPWENLGIPHSKVIQILRVDFPSGYFGILEDAQPTIYVSTANRRIYSLIYPYSWYPEGHSYYAVSDNKKEEKMACALKLGREWGIEMNERQNKLDVITMGECSTQGMYQYAAYKINQDGSVWRKYINEERPKNFRLTVSFYLCSTIIFYLLVWAGIFRKRDILVLHPDVRAN